MTFIKLLLNDTFLLKKMYHLTLLVYAKIELYIEILKN